MAAVAQPDAPIALLPKR